MTNATITAKIRSPALCRASCTLKDWRLYFKPPTKKESPATKSKFPNTEPVKEAKTIPISQAFSEKIEIISSTAFPNVALSKPPILGPITIAKLSVALPIKPATAIIVKQYTINMITSDQFRIEPITEIGNPIKTITINNLFIIDSPHSHPCPLESP